MRTSPQACPAWASLLVLLCLRPWPWLSKVDLWQAQLETVVVNNVSVIRDAEVGLEGGHERCRPGRYMYLIHSGGKHRQDTGITAIIQVWKRLALE